MKFKMKPVAYGLLSLFGCIGTVQAQIYTEVSYLNLSSRATVSAGKTESNGEVISGLIGYSLNSNFSVEGVLGTGLGGADVKLNGASQTRPVTSKLNQSYGAYLRTSMDLTPEVSVFARLGWNEWRTTASNSLASSSSTLSDWAYGAGMNYQINPTTYLSASWMNVYNKDSVKVDGWSIGLGHRY